MFRVTAKLVLVLAGPAPLCAAGNNEEWSQRKFIQRVAPAEFLALEEASNSGLSSSSDLVLIRVDGDGYYLSYALRHGHGYHLTEVRAAEPGAGSDQAVETNVIIPEETAELVKQALQIILEEKVFPLSARMQDHEPSSRSDWWIFLRKGDSQAIAGVALGHAMHINHSDQASMLWTILNGFRDLIRESGNTEELNLIMTELDRSTARFVGLQKLEQAQQQTKQRK